MWDSRPAAGAFEDIIAVREVNWEMKRLRYNDYNGYNRHQFAQTSLLQTHPCPNTDIHSDSIKSQLYTNDNTGFPSIQWHSFGLPNTSPSPNPSLTTLWMLLMGTHAGMKNYTPSREPIIIFLKSPQIIRSHAVNQKSTTCPWSPHAAQSFNK